MTLFLKGLRRKAVWPVCALALFLTVVSCSGNKATHYYLLQTISDPAPTKKGEAAAYVQLRKTGANVVTVVTTEKASQTFRIYKQEGGQGDLKDQGTVFSGVPKNIVQNWSGAQERTITFRDPGNSTIHDRYKIVPIVNDAEGAPIKVIYETDDADYFRQMEKKDLDK